MPVADLLLTEKRYRDKIKRMDERYFAAIPAAFVVFFTVTGILLLNGKWSRIIPGYNVAATNPDAIFFEKIFCRYVGVYVLILNFFFALVFVGLMIESSLFAGISGGLGAVTALFGYVGLLNSTRVKRAVYLAKNLEKSPNCLKQEEIEKWKNELGFNKRIKRKI